MQKNSGLQKKIMSVLNDVKSLEHWAYCHVKMNLPPILGVFELQALIRSQTTYMSRGRITEFTWEKE